jgi:Xaa-Pro aminopeptidase
VKEMMPKNSVAIFYASQVRNRNNDVDYQYAQNKNFYYLTGLDEPNAMLLLFKEPVTILDKTGTEFIFVQPRNPSQEMWTGKILGTDGVKARYKMDNVFTHEQFMAIRLIFQSRFCIDFFPATDNIIFKILPDGPRRRCCDGSIVEDGIYC